MTSPSGAPPQTAVAGAPRPGEWLCEVCGNVNYGSRTRCHMSVCGAPRGFPGPFKQGTVLGRTGPAPQPWTCPVCRNFNRATRDQCHRTGCSVVRTITNGVVSFTCPPTPERPGPQTLGTDRKPSATPGETAPLSVPAYSFSTDRRPRGSGPPPPLRSVKPPPPQMIGHQVAPPPPFSQPPQMIVAPPPPTAGYGWSLMPQWGGGLPVLGHQQMVLGGPPGGWISPGYQLPPPPPNAYVIDGHGMPAGVQLITPVNNGDSHLGTGGNFHK